MSEHDLLGRADALAGRDLAGLAHDLEVAVPQRPARAKGWAGQLLELALGASAGSSPQPDFPDLGVELKTVPVDMHGRPRESTYVCVVPLADSTGLRWEDSLVCRKLARVLWVPLLCPPHAGPGARVVGAPRLWSPSPSEAAALRADWEELMEMVALGRVAEISARLGTVLQIRPKAPNARSLGWSTDPDGRRVAVNPRGFYLRANFTRALLARTSGGDPIPSRGRAPS